MLIPRPCILSVQTWTCIYFKLLPGVDEWTFVCSHIVLYTVDNTVCILILKRLYLLYWLLCSPPIHQFMRGGDGIELQKFTTFQCWQCSELRSASKLCFIILACWVTESENVARMDTNDTYWATEKLILNSFWMRNLTKLTPIGQLKNKNLHCIG